MEFCGVLLGRLPPTPKWHLPKYGGEKEWSSIQQQGKGVLGMRLNQLALEDAAL